MLDFNPAQQLFLVLFSILFGVMLQSVIRLQAFPLERSLRGLVDRRGNVDLGYRDRWGRICFCRAEIEACYRVFSEDHLIEQTDYRGPFQRWLVHMWQERIFWSFIILNVLPAFYFWFILSVLEMVPVSFQLQFFPDCFVIFLIFWAALGVFGFYRFYHSLVARNWRRLFCDVRIKLEHEGTSLDARAHFVWAFVYFLPLVWNIAFWFGKSLSFF